MAAPVWDASSGAAGVGAVSSVTVAHTVGGGSNTAIITTVHWTGTRTVSSVTFNGTDYAGAGAPSGQMTGAFKEANVGLVMGVDTWLLMAPASGTHNVVGTISSATNMAVGSSSWSDVHQTAPYGNVATNSAASDTTPSVDVTAASDDIAIGATSGINVGSYSTSETAVFSVGSSGTYGFAQAYQVGGGSPLTLDWSGGFAGYGFVATGFALKPLAAGGISIPVITRQFRERWA